MVAIDFRVSNTSDYPAVVRNVLIYAEDKNGARLAGKTIADADAQRVFDDIPILGTKYLKSLVLEDKIPGHATLGPHDFRELRLPDENSSSASASWSRLKKIDGRIFEIAE